MWTSPPPLWMMSQWLLILITHVCNGPGGVLYHTCQVSVFSRCISSFQPFKTQFEMSRLTFKETGPRMIKRSLCESSIYHLWPVYIFTFYNTSVRFSRGPEATCFACHTFGCCHSCHGVVFITSLVSMWWAGPAVVFQGHKQTSHSLVNT